MATQLIILLLIAAALLFFLIVVRPRKSVFKEVKIGNQIWMAENLNLTSFRNGDSIAHAKTDKEWDKAGEDMQPAWCYYNNDPANGKRYGKLYNWHAVNDPRGLAPEGWIVPNLDNWRELTDFLGGKDIAGIKLKSTFGWDENRNGTNESGFSGLPGGTRSAEGWFYQIGSFGNWWSSKDSGPYGAWIRFLHYQDTKFDSYYNNKDYGLSIRCLRG